MLETARSGACAGSLQECSSIGRAPVSKTGGRRFEPCHSCHIFNGLAKYRTGNHRCHVSVDARHTQSCVPDWRSVLVEFRLREFLVDPAATVVAAPDPAAHQPTRDGSAWDDDRPYMPEARPGWHSFRCDFCVARHGHVTLLGIESLDPIIRGD
jgi:hypothetical protein